MSLFLPYKAVGYIADSTPFVINHLGDEDFLTVSIGRAIQIYRLPKLHVCLVSHEIPEDENGKISNSGMFINQSTWYQCLLLEECHDLIGSGFIFFGLFKEIELQKVFNPKF